MTSLEVRSRFFFAIIFIAALSGVLISPSFYNFLRAILQFVAYSSSPAKLVIYLLTGLVIFSLALIPNTAKISPSRIRVSKIIVCLAFANNFAVHLYYSYLVGISPREISIAVHTGNMFSVNSLIHTHVLKGIAAKLVILTGLQSKIGFTDVGYAFAEILPSWVFLYSSVIFLLLIWASYNFIILVASSAESQVGAKLWLLTFAIFTIVMRYIDGGLFAAELPPAIALLMMFSDNRINLSGSDFVKEHIKLTLIIIGTVEMVLVCLIGASDPFWLGSLGATCFYLLIEVLLLCLPLRNESRFSLVLLVFLLPQLIWMHQRGPFSLLNYLLNYKINPGGAVLLANPGTFDLPFPVAFREGELRIHKISQDRPFSLNEIYRDYDIRSAIRLFNIEGLTCNQNEPMVEAANVLMLKNTVIPQERPSALMEDFRIAKCKDDRKCDLQVEAKIKPCIPNHDLSVIINHLAELGLRNFVVIPARIYNYQD